MSKQRCRRDRSFSLVPDFISELNQVCEMLETPPFGSRRLGTAEPGGMNRKAILSLSSCL